MSTVNDTMRLLNKLTNDLGQLAKERENALTNAQSELANMEDSEMKRFLQDSMDKALSGKITVTEFLLSLKKVTDAG